ncbi:CynX/NimT family MFS transporter [Salininema proteolyticum]|uniref:CynX/NimT family MFS transporter n=1 Tax=Salininema proteolyticum TaxID=1607685 RepID=A0ABV8TWQ5_9ACTN
MVTQTEAAAAVSSRTRLPGYAKPLGLAAWVLIAGVVLASFNFRTAITSVGAILPEIQQGLGMSETLAGVLTTLPVVAFAVFGALTPRMMRRFGAKAVMAGSMLVMSLGVIARTVTDNTALFLVLSGVALIGGAFGNVALPAIVKEYFPTLIGPLMTTYSVSLAVGGAVAASVTVPVFESTRSWETTLALWAVPALLAAVVWLAWPQPSAKQRSQERERLDGVLKTRLAWMLMLFFGAQSSLAYIGLGWLPQILREDGMSAHRAGALFGLFTVVVIVPSLFVPMLAAARSSQRLLLLSMGWLSPAGVLGLWLMDGSGAWLWVTLFGLGMGMFPLSLTLFTLRARTPAGTEALSAFSQSAGYLIAGAGPFAMGALFGATGSFDLPFAFMFVLIAVQLTAGFYATANRFVEDEVASTR